MSGKTRRQQLEELLALEPDDSFLRYGLAMEHASEGDEEQAARQLLDLIAHDPEYVPAYLQAGQVLLRLGRDDEARAILTTGTSVATRKGDSHAAGEMQGFLQAIG